MGMVAKIGKLVLLLILFLQLNVVLDDVEAINPSRIIAGEEGEFLDGEISYSSHRVYGRKIDAEKFCTKIKNFKKVERFNKVNCNNINLRGIKPVFWMGHGWDIPDFGNCDPRYGILKYVKCGR